MSDSPELLKPNVEVTESGLHNELGNLKTENEGLRQELAKQKQDSALATTLSEKLTPDSATILSQLRARRKKSKTDLADLEAILEILES